MGYFFKHLESELLQEGTELGEAEEAVDIYLFGGRVGDQVNDQRDIKLLLSLRIQLHQYFNSVGVDQAISQGRRNVLQNQVGPRLFVLMQNRQHNFSGLLILRYDQFNNICLNWLYLAPPKVLNCRWIMWLKHSELLYQEYRVLH